MEGNTETQQSSAPTELRGDVLEDAVDGVPMQQAYEMCNAGGHLITTGLVRGTIALPAFLFAIGGISHSGGQAGGANPMRDIPRFVSLMESGRYDTKPLVTRVVPLQDMLGAYEEVAYGTTVTAIMRA